MMGRMMRIFPPLEVLPRLKHLGAKLGRAA
jgi:hypothetical protein